MEVADEVAGEVVLRHPRVVLARERRLRDHRLGQRSSGAQRAENETDRNDLERGQGPVRVVGEEERVALRIEAQLRRARAAGALHHQVDVGPHLLDQAQVDEDEQNVVVARHQVRAWRQRLEQRAAEVLGDAVVAAVVAR